jgi:hypothetical protein
MLCWGVGLARRSNARPFGSTSLRIDHYDHHRKRDPNQRDDGSAAIGHAGGRQSLRTHQQKNVTVYESRDHIRVLDNTATVDGKAVVPGWTLSVAEIFD